LKAQIKIVMLQNICIIIIIIIIVPLHNVKLKVLHFTYFPSYCYFEILVLRNMMIVIH